MKESSIQIRKSELEKIIMGWAEEKKILQPGEMIELELRIIKQERFRVSITGYNGVSDPRFISVDEVGFTVRTSNCLNNGNISTLGELADKSKDELLKYRNFGKKALRECQEKLLEAGIKVNWL